MTRRAAKHPPAGRILAYTALKTELRPGYPPGPERLPTSWPLHRRSYFGLRSFLTLYGFTWTAYAIAGAIGRLRMGMALDVTGSYTLRLVVLACVTFVSALLYLVCRGTSSSSTPTLTK